MKRIVTKEELKNEITKKRVLIDFYATWCGPCKMLASVIEKITEENIIDVVKIDVDEALELAKEYSIHSIPTLILFEDGKEKKRNMGFIGYEELKSWVQDNEE